MGADFNKEFKGFADQSASFQEVMGHLQREDTYVHGTPERRRLWESAARASFESVVIYRDLIPRQACILMREPLTNLIHEHHSDESKAFMRALVDESSLTVRVAHTITQLAMMKEPSLARLKSEVAQWRARADGLALGEAQVPPEEPAPKTQDRPEAGDARCCRGSRPGFRLPV